MEVKKPLVKSLPFILATLLLCYSCHSPSSTKSASFPVLPQIARSGVGRGAVPTWLQGCVQVPLQDLPSRRPSSACVQILLLTLLTPPAGSPGSEGSGYSLLNLSPWFWPPKPFPFYTPWNLLLPRLFPGRQSEGLLLHSGPFLTAHLSSLQGSVSSTW